MKESSNRVEKAIEKDNTYLIDDTEFWKNYFDPNTWDRTRNMYKQWGQAWSEDKIDDLTICQAGGLVSSVSMILHSRGIKIDGQEATPKTLNTWLKKNGGYIGNQLNWISLDALGIKFTREAFNHTEMRMCICDSAWLVFFAVEKGSHYIEVIQNYI